LILLFTINGKVRSFDVETLSLRNRLDELKREIEALVRLARSARGAEPAAEAPPTPPPAEQPAPVSPATEIPIATPPIEPESAAGRLVGKMTAAQPSEAVKPAPAAPAGPPPLPIQAQAQQSQPAAEPEQAAAPKPPAAEAPSQEPESSAGNILSKIWSWILVGEEHRQTGMSREFVVATTWLTRIGIILVVTCVSYFLKWSIQHGLIGHMGRVALAIGFGLALLVSGLLMINRRWNIMGQAFLGGGLATLYFGMYAAGPLYDLLPPPAVFALMVAITLTAGVLAVRTKSMLVAIFGIVGGFCTPIMLRTDTPQLPVFYAYLLLLNLGILGIAHFRQWRLLNYLGFLFTYALFFTSFDQYQRADFPVAITFLSCFFLIQSMLIIIYNIRRGIPTTVLEIVHLMLNAAVFSSAAYYLIRDAYGRPYPALLTLALAVFYILQVARFLQRRRQDRPLLLTLIALAGFFTALTLPLAMEKESLTMAWSLLAFTFVWLGLRLHSNFLHQLGYLMFGILFGRLVFFELPSHYEVMPTAATPWAEYSQAMLNRLMNFGVAIVATAAAFLLERRQAIRERAGGAAPGVVDPANDLPSLLPSSASAPILFWGALLTAFAFLQLELYAMLTYYPPLRPAIATLLCCGLAGYFLSRYRATRQPVSLVGLCILLAIVTIKIIGPDFQTWDVADDFYFKVAYLPATIMARWLDFASLLGLLFAAWALLGRRAAAPQVFGYTGLALLFLFATLEVNSLLHWKLEMFQAGGLSILWALFAAAYIAGGIWKGVRPLRYIGLTLFAVIVVKVFFVDLRDMEVIYKALAALAVGVLLLAGAFAYLHAGRQFETERSNANKTAGIP
jgi:uncharacterized membrane protein